MVKPLICLHFEQLSDEELDFKGRTLEEESEDERFQLDDSSEEANETNVLNTSPKHSKEKLLAAETPSEAEIVSKVRFLSILSV